MGSVEKTSVDYRRWVPSLGLALVQDNLQCAGIIGHHSRKDRDLQTTRSTDATGRNVPGICK